MLFEWSPLKIDRNTYYSSSNSATYLFLCNIGLFLIMLIAFSLSQGNTFEFLKYIFYLGFITLGMAHGASDHLFLWGTFKKLNLFKKILGLVGYAFLSILYLMFWKLYPIASLSTFIAITIIHWGQGDRYFCYKFFKCNYLKDSFVLKILNILVKGSIPIFITIFGDLVFFHSFLESLLKQLDHKACDISLLFSIRYVFLIIPILLFVSYLISLLSQVRHFTKSNLKGIFIDIIETVFLFLWFLLLPALLSLGIYFIFWHSLRHAIRILYIDRKFIIGTSKIKGLNICFRWFQLTGAMTALAFIGSSFLLSYNLLEPNFDLEWISISAIAISCLTFPHFITVSLMDRIEIGNQK